MKHLSTRAGIAASAVTLVAAGGGMSHAAVDVGNAGEHAAAACERTFFDDFHYASSSDSRLEQRGWNVRTGAGGPGISGADWSASNISFPGGNLRLRASTDGTGNGTDQSEIGLPRKFREGTYAARVKFADAPDSGPDGDHLVETFFTITPLAEDMAPNYSEIDFEYLPNGGWGMPSSTIFETTWETYGSDPWKAVNAQDEQRRSYGGWQDLLFTVSDGHVKYYIDGVLVADHSGKYYPESEMSVSFNLWFIDGDGHTTGTSVYTQQVDYLYHAAGETIGQREVDSRVAGLRDRGVRHRDTMDSGSGSCPTLR